MKIDVVERLHQPEYTGENRCEPCTILNLIIAGLLGSAIAKKSKAGGAVLFAVSIALIYLRGYLVPGTPTLTKRYLPPEVLRWFGKEPETPGQNNISAFDHQNENTTSVEDEGTPVGVDSDDSADDSGVDVDPNEYFLKHGIVEPCESTEDLCLTDDFESDWSDEIDQVNATDIDGDDVATVFGVDTDEDDFEIEQYDDARMLVRDETHIAKWPSQAALVADITASQVLQSWDDNWKSFDPNQKSQLLSGLRLFLEVCPTSGGSVTFSQETVESCCTSTEVATVTCEDTDERLFEYPVNDITA